jgi:putative FmdB family regulatory protein
MPIYEFRCPDCEYEFEELLPMSRVVAPCPQCGRQKTNQKISGFHFPRRRILPIPELTQPVPHRPRLPKSQEGFNGGHLQNVRIVNGHVGLGIGPNGNIRSKGLQIENCDIAIDNAGKFDGPDTIIK